MKKIKYDNTELNNPPNILKHPYESIQERPTNTSNEEIFNKSAAAVYQRTLDESKHNTCLKSEKKYSGGNNNEKTKSNKKIGRIIWFSNSYNTNIKDEVARRFVKLINKHFTTRLC